MTARGPGQTVVPRPSAQKTKLLLVFTSLAYLACHFVPLLPRVMDRTIPIPIPGFTWHEVAEMLLSPIFVCSCWILVQDLKPTRDTFHFILFLVLTCIAEQGQGIHMASNAIHSTINPGQEYFSGRGSTFELTYFLDENLGHHLVFAAIAFLFFYLLKIEQRERDPVAFQSQHKTPYDDHWHFLDLVLFILAIFHGVTWFMAGVEGQTVLTLSIPFCVLLLIDAVMQKLAGRSPGVLGRYLYIGAVVSLALLLLWGRHFGWTWPEFRVLGLGPFSTWLGQFQAALKKWGSQNL